MSEASDAEVTRSRETDEDSLTKMPNDYGASLGFETKLFTTADKLRGNMKPWKQKHVDRQIRPWARTRIRVLVKRILRKHEYPADIQEAALRTVLPQAEALSTRWAA